MSSTIERRKHTRIQIDQMIELQFGQEQYIRAEGVDLSETGMLCSCADPVDPQTSIYLLFRIPVQDTEHEVQCDGIVVRSVKEKNRYIVAIQFTDITSTSQAVLHDYVKHKAYKAPKKS